MSINHIIPSIQLSEPEEKELCNIFSNPLVQKYLRILGTEDSKDLLSLSLLDMLDREIANRHHFVSGKLAVISTLLSITTKE